MDESSDEEHFLKPSTSKKKPSHGRMREVMSKLRLQSHETGPPCKCKQQCFLKVGEKKSQIITRMNSMKSNDEINCYLAGLIVVLPVAQRRPRKDPLEAAHREATFSYCVKYIKDDGKAVEINVCKQAFCSLHGIGRGKLEHLLKALKNSAEPPKDNRGKHKNRPHAVSQETKNKIIEHIKSLKGRESHYSLKDSTKTYLPEELNITKIFRMFQEQNPWVKNALYETYRQIFNTNFNIGFGYPRSDTCSKCDEFKLQKKNLEIELQSTTTDGEKRQIQSKLKDIYSDKTIHLLRADKWYKLKRQAKFRSRTDNTKEAIVYDYAKNHHVPNITTGEVYYKRQLSVYVFNIHILSTGQSVFYTYAETTGHKGSDEVCSFLHHFFYNFLDSEVKELEFFSDSCAGQNKNNFIFKFYHHLVHKEKRFEKVTGYFPIKGHSYNECDKNCALIKKTYEAELPEDWAEVIRNSRVKPSPFDVVEADQSLIKGWTSHLNGMYRKKLGCATRPIRIFMVHNQEPAYMLHKSFFSGPWKKNPMVPKRQATQQTDTPLEEGTFLLPSPVYEGKPCIFVLDNLIWL